MPASTRSRSCSSGAGPSASRQVAGHRRGRQLRTAAATARSARSPSSGCHHLRRSPRPPASASSARSTGSPAPASSSAARSPSPCRPAPPTRRSRSITPGLPGQVVQPLLGHARAGRDQPDALEPAPARRGAPPPARPPPACRTPPHPRCGSSPPPPLPAPTGRSSPAPARPARHVRHPDRDHSRLPGQARRGISGAGGRDIRQRDRVKGHEEAPARNRLLVTSSSTGSLPPIPASAPARRGTAAQPASKGIRPAARQRSQSVTGTGESKRCATPGSSAATTLFYMALGLRLPARRPR